MTEEVKKFFETYTDFVTKVTSDPSLDLDDLSESFNKIENALLSLLSSVYFTDCSANIGCGVSEIIRFSTQIDKL